MNIIIMVGNKFENKIENGPKVIVALRDLTPLLRKVDWSTEEWFLWRYNWNGIGNPTQIVEAINSHKEIEIAEYINKIIQRLEKIK